ERLNEDRGGIELAACPAPARVDQFRSRDADDQDREAAREIGYVLDQIEIRRFCPVNVVDDDDERTFSCERLKQSSDSPEDLFARASLGTAEADRLGHALDNELGL